LKTNYKIANNLLLFLLLTGFSLSIHAQNAWINEFHYDNAGTDANEMIEVAIESPGSYSLSLFSVILYTGNNGTIYGTANTLDLFTVGVTSGDFTLYYFMYPVDGIQNGAPDGIALAYNSILIPGQFLSYEGAFTGVGGAAGGVMSVNVGVSENSGTPATHSLQLSGTGSRYSSFTWQAPATATAGALNTGQTFIDNPANFNALAFSHSRIDLSWSLNINVDSVMVAYYNTNTFGTPAGIYPVGAAISGGGIVLYKGIGTSTIHSGLLVDSTYYYKIWSYTSAHFYSSGKVDSARTFKLEPYNYPTAFTAVSNGTSQVTISWTDSDAAHYLIKGSVVGYSSIVPPFDGGIQVDSLLVKNVDASVQSQIITGLGVDSTYYFNIYPYNGTGESVDYKTDGTVPHASAKTDAMIIDLIISEVADPRDSTRAKFVEIYNPGIYPVNFSTTPIFLCRQANGGTNWGSVQLTGTLSPGGTHVIGYVFSVNDTVRFYNAFGFVPNQYSNFISGNGDDGYFIFYNGNQSNGVLIDAFGIINEDGTGKPWEYEDKKAVRKRNIDVPNTTWTPSEWIILADSAKVKDMTPGYHKGNVTWQGTTSTNWNAKGLNWSSPNGYIPDASCSVIIPCQGVTNFPIITEPAACQELQLLDDNPNSALLRIQSTGSLLIVGP
jgi:hypothetical protein